MILDTNHEPNQIQPQPNPNPRLKYILIRSAIILSILILVVINTVYGVILPHSNIDCVVDKSFSWTNSINAFFLNDPISRSVLLIICGLSADLILIALGITWIINGKSWRVFLTLSIFYLFKFFLQFVFQIRTPEGSAWGYPGFPSILLGYQHNNAFFYSTSTGVILIAAMEAYKTENKYLFALTIPVLVLEIFTKNVLRGNYFIDIVSACVIAHFTFMLMDELCPKYLDSSKNEWLSLEAEKENQYKNIPNEDQEDIDIPLHKY